MVEPERHQQHVAGEPLAAPRRASWQTVASVPSRGLRKTRSPARTCVIAPRACAPMGHPPRARRCRCAAAPGRRARRGGSRPAAIANATSAPWWPANSLDGGEHHEPEDDQREDVQQRLGHDRAETVGSSSRGRPRRRATTSARDGSPRRAGSVADISTPMDVPLQRVAALTRVARQRRAQDRVPGHGAQDHGEAHQRRADEHPRRARASSASTMRSMPMRCSASHGARAAHRGEAEAGALARRRRGGGRPAAAARGRQRRGGRGQAVGGAQAEAHGERARPRRLGAGRAIASS